MTIFDDMLTWLHKNGTPEAVKVLRYEEGEQEGVACGEGTCWDSWTVIYIYYVKANGVEDYDWYEGELTEFIKELTDAH